MSDLELDALSPENVTHIESAEKIVTSSSTELQYEGCAKELLPYKDWMLCDPRAKSRA